MNGINLTEGSGFAVGDLLRISAEAFETRVVRITPYRVLVDWPWWHVDPQSANSWDGTVGFPRDPDAYDWCNTPWRLEPDPSELEPGSWCFVGILPTFVRVTDIVLYAPPQTSGFCRVLTMFS